MNYPFMAFRYRADKILIGLFSDGYGEGTFLSGRTTAIFHAEKA